jgi:SAM-dependent methyltransferase
MSLRHAAEKRRPSWSETENGVVVAASTHHYAPYLRTDRDACILDIGFGGGWFLAACLKLGYRNLHGADFGIQHKSYIRDWSPDRITLHEIQDNVGNFLSDKKEQFDFIHLSHVIEHVPKYSLFWVVDALYWALKRGGTVLLRTPNMEGPCANSSLYGSDSKRKKQEDEPKPFFFLVDHCSRGWPGKSEFRSTLQRCWLSLRLESFSGLTTGRETTAGSSCSASVLLQDVTRLRFHTLFPSVNICQCLRGELACF